MLHGRGAREQHTNILTKTGGGMFFCGEEEARDGKLKQYEEGGKKGDDRNERSLNIGE